MIPKNYWSPQEWPYEAEGMIFGCPAVHRVGHHLFPGEWRENDPRSPSPSFPSDHSQPEIWPENVTTANRQQRFEAASYLTTTYPELASRYPLLGRSGVRPQILPDIHLTSEQWQMAHRKRAEMAALQAEVRDRLRKGYRRFSEVKEIYPESLCVGAFGVVRAIG